MNEMQNGTDILFLIQANLRILSVKIIFYVINVVSVTSNKRNFNNNYILYINLLTVC